MQIIGKPLRFLEFSLSHVKERYKLVYYQVEDV